MSEKPFMEAVRILAATAWADGEIGEREAQMIRAMIDVGPLTDAEKTSATAWLHTRPKESVSTIDKLTMDARRDLYLSAVRMAAADGRTVRAERGFLAKLQQSLKLSDDVANEVRDKVKSEAKKASQYAKLYRLAVYTLGHDLTSLSSYRGKALLLVNVASECGLTGQYKGLQELHDTYKDKGFTVIGFPCNQFGGQEPGTPEQIAEFCETNYQITFPLMDKIEVNGDKRHDIYELLCEVPDADGEAGDIKWNFEKFVVSHDADVITRFRPAVEPDDPALISAIKAALPPVDPRKQD